MNGDTWSLIIMGFLFFGIAVIGQNAHDKGKSWGRKLQYVLGAVFIGLMIWLITYVL